MGMFDRTNICDKCGRGKDEGSGFEVKSVTHESRGRNIDSTPSDRVEKYHQPMGRARHLP